MQLFIIVHVPIQPRKNDVQRLCQSRTGRHRPIPVSTESSAGKILRVHTIITEALFAYVIDGKQVPKSVFEQSDPNGINSITVIKDGSRDDIDIKGYIGWENGVVLVETKKRRITDLQNPTTEKEVIVRL